MICRLLQDRAPACLECGATTMVSLVSGAEGLKYESLAIAASSPRSRKETIANATGTLAIIGAYAGICLGAAFWWPAIPIILGAGVGAAGLNAALSKPTPIAPVDMLTVALAQD